MTSSAHAAGWRGQHRDWMIKVVSGFATDRASRAFATPDGANMRIMTRLSTQDTWLNRTTYEEQDCAFAFGTARQCPARRKLHAAVGPGACCRRAGPLCCAVALFHMRVPPRCSRYHHQRAAHRYEWI